MSNGQDDFIDGLAYQVKEEVIGNYLRERRILDEEIREYRENLGEYRALESELREARDALACLLADRDNFEKFFSLLGYDAPPLDWLGHQDSLDWAPACPLGLTPRGLTKRGRYLDLVMKTYEIFRDKAIQAQESAEELADLSAEVNNDIDRFHRNFDLLAIIGLLRKMDVETSIKKKFMGENFTAAELGSIEQTMTFPKLNAAADGLDRDWPELPTVNKARRMADDFLEELFTREREIIIPAL